MALVLTATMAVPRSSATVLHLAVCDDHSHVDFVPSGHSHEQHDDCHDHSFVHDHDYSDADAEGDESVRDAHEHKCLAIGLPAADYQRLKVDPQPVQSPLALPLPVCPLIEVRPHLLGYSLSPVPLGVPPPDLLRSTILLI